MRSFVIKKVERLSFVVFTAAMLIVSAAPAFAAESLGSAYDFSNQSGPGGGWRQEANGTWKYIKGFDCISNAWELIDGYWYRFSADGTMLTGWHSIDGNMYYLAEGSTGAHPMGSLYVDERTPDGREVDSDGRLIIQTGADFTDGIVRPNPYGARTLVEVDVPNQRVYVYDRDRLIISSPCVTGSVAGGHSTPAGQFTIKSKETNRYLRGTNNDGSKYASYVNFWMPFNGGIGLHDASWRDSFGGSIYQSGGSHGCVNMPFAKAQALYSVAYVGMTVIVHY